ncbi:glycosyltransferase [Agarivorans gilvus]|uniref:Glycosyl transferase family 1 n=1 Tax=Agarivorans gilvus TaxID=680279 RepID=A0ABQ1I3M0_9ALTE|nr:glycosyltransferase [Agarivorans gilvus]GGB08828.1 glycosyl transferase family 1 [Agarivorans gilvus]
MSNKAKLLIVTNLYPVPWAPNRASFNAQQFAQLEQYFEVSILVFVPWLEWLRHRKQCQTTTSLKYLPYFYLPKVGRKLYPFFQGLALSLNSRWIRAKAPNIVLASWGYPDAVAVMRFFSKLNQTCFIKVHGTDVNGNFKFAERKRQMVNAMKQAEMVFCPSLALAKRLLDESVDPDKVVTIYNGVDRKIFFPGDKRANRLVFVGNIIKTKGVLELYQAFKFIHHKRPLLTLEWVGEGSLRKQLEEQAKQDGLGSKVIFHGSLPLIKVADIVRHSLLLILPSYQEGLPNVLLEAFACGTPVVASAVGGIPEIVNDKTGVLINEISAPAIAEAVIYALEHDWDYAALEEFASSFDWQRNAKQVADYLNKAIN